MATHERDEFETLADYYDERICEEIKKLHAVVDSLAASEQSMTYAQFLQLERSFEHVRDAMHARDKFGTHSYTGRSRFRHIAHPEQYPAPPETALV